MFSAIYVSSSATQSSEYWNFLPLYSTKKDASNINFEINIPAVEKQKFFDYMAQDVGNGYSAAQIDELKQDIPTQVMLRYLRFKKFDFGTLINQLAKQERVKSLTEQISKSSAIQMTETPNFDNGQSVNLNDISLESMGRGLRM